MDGVDDDELDGGGAAEEVEGCWLEDKRTSRAERVPADVDEAGEEVERRTSRAEDGGASGVRLVELELERRTSRAGAWVERWPRRAVRDERL